MKKFNFNPMAIPFGLDASLTLTLAILWSLPTLFNGFPLFYYDSSYYLVNAFDVMTSAKIAWRPMTYSLLLGPIVSTIGYSGFIIVQNWIVSSYLLKVSRVISEKINRLTFLLIGVLLSMTPMIFVGNFIMPDIYSTLAILGVICFFATDDFEKKFFFVTAGIFSYMHFSNIFCTLPLVIFYLSRNNLKPLLTCILVTFFLLLGRILLFFPSKNLEETTHYFIFSRFVAFEVTEVYFNKVCPKEDLFFCDHRDVAFNIWGDRVTDHIPSKVLLPSVVTANQEILKSTLFWTYFFRSLQNSWTQAMSFASPMEILLNDKFLVVFFQRQMGSNVFNYQHPRFFNDINFSLEYLKRGLSTLFFLVTSLSFFASIWLLYKKKLDLMQELFLLFFTASYVLNSLVIGLLSEPLSRYNNKLAWGFTFLCLCFVVSQFSIFKTKQEIPDD